MWKLKQLSLTETTFAGIDEIDIIQPINDSLLFNNKYYFASSRAIRVINY